MTRRILLEEGQRVIALTLVRFKKYNGQEARITKGFGTNSGTDIEGNVVKCPDSYEITFADGQKVNVDPEQIVTAPPIRGDMDTRVGWSWMDPDVVRAIINGPVKDY